MWIKNNRKLHFVGRLVKITLENSYIRYIEQYVEAVVQKEVKKRYY